MEDGLANFPSHPQVEHVNEVKIKAEEERSFHIDFKYGKDYCR